MCGPNAKMYTSKSWMCSLLLLVILHHDVACGPFGEDSNVKCDDISEAINYLHDHLPEGMSMEDRCKRYIVMTSLLRPRGRLHNIAVSKVLKMSEVRLDRVHRELQETNELDGLYMAAIDGYRAASMLGPALFELVECMKQIDGSAARKYLEGQELNVILKLYRQVLETPDLKIDLDYIRSLGKFSRAFFISVMHLFRKHIDDSRFENLIYRISDGASSSRQIPAPMIDDEADDYEAALRLHKRREERKILAAHRHREQERLRRQRIKILDPFSEKERTRLINKEQGRPNQAEFRLGDISPRPLYASLPGIPYDSALLQRQQSQPEQEHSPDSARSSFQTPDLMQLWSEVAPIYQSIPTPTISAQQQPAESASPYESEESYQNIRDPSRRMHEHQLDSRSSDRSSYGQQSPDLAQLWSEAAPIYESIATPTISGSPQPQPKQPTRVSTMRDLLSPSAASTAPAQGTSAGSIFGAPASSSAQFAMPPWPGSAQQQQALFSNLLHFDEASSSSPLHQELGWDLPTDDYAFGIGSTGGYAQFGHTVPTVESEHVSNDTNAIVQSFFSDTPEEEFAHGAWPDHHGTDDKKDM